MIQKLPNIEKCSNYKLKKITKSVSTERLKPISSFEILSEKRKETEKEAVSEVNIHALRFN